VTLYELVTGEKPFRGKNADELFQAIARGRFRRVRAVAHDCPRRLARIIERCLSRAPERRFGSAGALARKLDTCAAKLLRKVHPRARLVAHLANRGYVTEEIALSRVDLTTLAATRIRDAKGSPTLTSFPVRRLHRRARVAFVTLAAVAAGVAAWLVRLP
jgi:serine/threonine-protein kinase